MITLEIYVDGKTIGTRQWPAVPRYGDYIFLPDQSKVRVIGVVWGNSEGSHKRRGEVHVAVLCESQDLDPQTKRKIVFP